MNTFRVTLGQIWALYSLLFLIQKSEKQWKVLSGFLKNLPLGTPSGHQTFPQGCAPRESLMTLGNSQGQIFPDNHCGLYTVYTTVLLDFRLGPRVSCLVSKKAKFPNQNFLVTTTNLLMCPPFSLTSYFQLPQHHPSQTFLILPPSYLLELTLPHPDLFKRHCFCCREVFGKYFFCY